MDISMKDLRIAALINLFDVVTNVDMQEHIRNELWCLRNDISSDGLWDITLARHSTSELLKTIKALSNRTPEEQSALLVCTLHEIS